MSSTISVTSKELDGSLIHVEALEAQHVEVIDKWSRRLRSRARRQRLVAYVHVAVAVKVHVHVNVNVNDSSGRWAAVVLGRAGFGDRP